MLVSPDRQDPTRRRWGWGERMLAQITELEAECSDISDPDVDPNVLKSVSGHLESARKALEARPRKWRRGPAIDRALSNYHTAVYLLARHTCDEQLRGRLPEIAATVARTLPPDDQRRRAVDKLARRAVEAPSRLSCEERESISRGLRAALREEEREQARIRSFRNIVWWVAGALLLLAVSLGVAGALWPKAVPLCFNPEEAGKVVCPTGSAPVATPPTVRELERAYQDVAAPWDYAVLEAAGLVAAAIAAAASLRRIRGTSTPYGVPVALAALKLPTGALTAVLGLLLMRGQFVPGLSALDTSAQIIAWAVVFGYAQQAFTKLVDQRGQDILDTTSRPDEGQVFRHTKLQ